MEFFYNLGARLHLDQIAPEGNYKQTAAALVNNLLLVRANTLLTWTAFPFTLSRGFFTPKIWLVPPKMMRSPRCCYTLRVQKQGIKTNVLPISKCSGNSDGSKFLGLLWWGELSLNQINTIQQGKARPSIEFLLSFLSLCLLFASWSSKPISISLGSCLI